MLTPLNPLRTIAELKELRTLTSTHEGAQRVAWTETWDRARAWMRDKLATLPVEVRLDEAGNLWATLPGASPRALIIGSHIDSVPNGGWLDGALGLVAGLEVLRTIAARGTPPVTIRLVDWADEEGRFGYSLLGSSAASGTLRPEHLLTLHDRNGITLPAMLTGYGVDVEQMGQAGGELIDAAAYLELHIEQGPVLETQGLPLATVTGTCGVERYKVIWHGQAAHSGSTPMNQRRDALAGAAKLTLALREIAHEVGDGAVCTSGSVVCSPGIATSVAENVVQMVDMRHHDSIKLARLLNRAQRASWQFAAEEHLNVTWERIYQIAPITFHPQLIELAEAAVIDTCGVYYHMTSGPLHDATEMARSGIPTVMLFVQSLRGISHSYAEDTREEHLELAVRALANLTDRVIEWLEQGGE
ncbi:amidase, hydantoinase/carbamoylase family [Oscillochloris trichoides DG-6]|uniref:Amidase, hydantoinase/carbamoylase family n=1 Tax=Oscillochloris trichoides DG-6 TaxID=765420 RepID=E1IBG1_9CHLR|nr:Zn-dependent hydrolase [Oscillochloris trichoides]EFO81518.1 amidase, hydantoinase/carbamoylase family [Oscillochloris trichoides DG-6]